MTNWTEDDHPTPEQERETWAREECARLGFNPDEVCADGGVEAWMIIAQESDAIRLRKLLADVRAYLGGTNPLVTSGGVKNIDLRRRIDAAIAKAEGRP